MKQIRRVYKFIVFFLTATNSHGHGVHSPFCYQFIQSVIYNKNQFYFFSQIEKVRLKLHLDKRALNINDLGTGNNKIQTVTEIASKSLKSAKYGQLFFKIVHYFKMQNVLELGTSLGITTAYLAASSTEIKCVSLEGCISIAKIAEENFKKLKLENIQVVTGNIDQTLPKVLSDFETLDFVFIDANHKLPSVYDYFEICLTKIHTNTIIIIDDIYWSVEMEQAWKMIKNHSSVTVTIDLFQLGIVFFNTDLYKNHYKIRF
jgi:predicted O-methyltransferase YrrM